MRKLIEFWRKDIINKLIVLVLVSILAALSTLMILLTGTATGKSLVSSLIPTQTLSVDAIFRSGEATTTTQAKLTLTAVVPTITSLPFTPLVLPTIPPTATVRPTSTTTPTPTLTLTPTVTGTSTPKSGGCLLNKTAQTGKVLEILDGITVRIMIDNLVYLVRYAGIDLPPDAATSQLTQYQNGKMTYMKEVLLYSDQVDKDDRNRLLRYIVLADATMVNEELVRQGLASASKTPSSCSEIFAAAQQEAQDRHLGMWKAARP